MKFKPRTPTKTERTEHFNVKVEEIPSITGNPIKFLGKCTGPWVIGKNVTRLTQLLKNGMRNIDKTNLPDKFIPTWTCTKAVLASGHL
jgi:hypothetical protein